MEGLNTGLVIIALALAGGAIGIMAILGARARAQFVFAQLCLMSGIYVGFAIAELEAASFITRAELTPLIINSVIAIGLVFAGLAVLGSTRVWLLGVLIMAHGAFDLIHLLTTGGISPDWYAFACVLYDAIVGVAAVIMLSARTKSNA